MFRNKRRQRLWANDRKKRGVVPDVFCSAPKEGIQGPRFATTPSDYRECAPGLEPGK
jgi:hypothetical protein